MPCDIDTVAGEFTGYSEVVAVVLSERLGGHAASSYEFRLHAADRDIETISSKPL